MRLFSTIFKILSFVFQKLKMSRDNDHAPFRDSLPSIGWDLLWSTTYQIWSVYDYLQWRYERQCQCKNSCYERPFGWLRSNAQGLSMAWWKACCRLPISDNWTFLLALTAEALLSEICRNLHFLKGGSLWAPLEVFTQRNFAADFFRQKLNFTGKKQQNRVLLCHSLGGLRANIHGSSMACWKACVWLSITASWTSLVSSHGWGAMSGYWPKSLCLKGGGSLWV